MDGRSRTGLNDEWVLVRDGWHGSVHSKNSQVRFDLERIPFGQTHFWVRLIRNLGQTDTKSESKMSF